MLALTINLGNVTNKYYTRHYIAVFAKCFRLREVKGLRSHPPRVLVLFRPSNDWRSPPISGTTIRFNQFKCSFHPRTSLKSHSKCLTKYLGTTAQPHWHKKLTGKVSLPSYIKNFLSTYAWPDPNLCCPNAPERRKSAAV